MLCLFRIRVIEVVLRDLFDAVVFGLILENCFDNLIDIKKLFIGLEEGKIPLY